MSQGQLLINVVDDPRLRDRISHTPLSKSLRRTILRAIFSINLTESEWEARHNFASYFTDWYEDQCEAAASQVSERTHQDIINVITCFKDSSLNRDDILQRVRQQHHHGVIHDDRILSSIDLAARLWLTTTVGSLPQSITPGNTVRWLDGPLQWALKPIMSPVKPVADQVQLPKIFTAMNLEKFAGLKIKWTSNLADHLCLKEDDTEVCIYHQVSFLELHLSGDSTLSKDFIEETIRTLALLIPSSDRTTQKWFRQKQKEHLLDPRAGRFGPLDTASRQTDSFYAWRDRLVLLKQAFDDSEPNTLQSWWYDDRKKVQWYTFWIALLVLLLTIVFGLIQSISGVVQAWAAVRSMPD